MEQQPSAPNTSQKLDHNSVEITPGMSVDDYVSKSLHMHYGAAHQGIVNGGLLQFSRKVGDMALAVIPKNRFWCAVGLTTGGYAGLKFGALLAGRNLANHEELSKDSYPKLLQPLHGLLKYDPHSSATGDRWKRVGALFTFTAISFAGIMMGAAHAYKPERKRNSHPDSLEDYVARTSQHQGDKWRWLAANSGVFGSSSGTYLIPYVPGVNYAVSIASYTTLNQDRRIMTPGLKKMTGTKTTSYLGLREGVDFICKYAVNNPSKDPAELEYLALTVMAPIADAAGVKLKPENIKTFVDTVHSVRDKYWQEGGIPREQRAAAMKDMEAHFKGKGLDQTLFASGIDTMDIDFTKLNGLIGKVGNSMGATKKIKADQDAYRAMATQWRTEWPQSEEQTTRPLEVEGAAISPAQPEKLFAREELKKVPAVITERPPVSHQEALTARAASNDAMAVQRA